MSSKLFTVGMTLAGLSAVSLAALRGIGERCMGADGYPAVEWIPCPDGFECVASPDLGYGKFCLSAMPSEEPEESMEPEMSAEPTDEAMASPEDDEYYSEGEKCMGAPGYPAVPWLPCAAGLECVEDATLGWGKFCMKPAEPTCAANWNRCAGGGETEWPDLACCDSSYECVDPVEEGYLGYRCQPQAVTPVTVPGIEAKTCADNWETCGGRGSGEMGCCDSSFSCVDPVEENYYGLRCEPSS